MPPRSKEVKELAALVAGRVEVSFQPEALCEHRLAEKDGRSAGGRWMWWRCPTCGVRFRRR